MSSTKAGLIDQSAIPKKQILSGKRGLEALLAPAFVA